MTLSEKVQTIIDKVWGGEHHVVKVTKNDFCWIVTINKSMATYDFQDLTRLVILAHELCVRVEIASNGWRLKILFHDRNRGAYGDVIHYHPTIEESIKRIRAE